MSENGEEYVIIEHRSGGSFGTFVWGLLIGAAAALLYAPKSGRETREELSESADRLRGQAEDRVREVQDTVTAAVEDARRQFEEGVDTARKAMESGRAAVKESRAQVERRMAESKEAFESGYDAARAEAGGEDAAGEGGADEPTGE